MTLDRIENGEYVLQNTQFISDPEAGTVLNFEIAALKYYKDPSKY